MKKIFTALLFLMLFPVVCFAQTGGGTSTYFNLSVLNENDEVPSGIFVSVNYEQMGLLPLKSYAGNDNAIARVSEIMGYATANNINAYKGVSKKGDSTIENSFQFYNVFTSHSENPKLYGRATIGKYVMFYVELEEGLPLVVFLLEKNGDAFINYPLMSEHPAITALSDAVNKTYLYPELFKPVNNIPAKNTTVSFDSSLQLANTGFAFYFDMDRITFNTADKKDTANAYDKKYKPALDHYRNMLGYLSASDIGKFYSGLSVESKERVANSFKMSGGATGNALRYYKNDKTFYSRVINVADLGNTKLLFVNSPGNQRVKTIRRVYIATIENEIKWINENMEFYLDDLFRTDEFTKILFTKE